LQSEFSIDLKLIVLVRNLKKFENKTKEYDLKNTKVIVQDLTQPFQIKDSVDFVIHGASNANPNAYVEFPVETITTNVVGTYNLVNSLGQNGALKNLKSFVFLSTMEVYGEHNHKNYIDESVYGSIDSKKIRNSYPLSKSATENLLLDYFDEYKLPVIIDRLGYIYGVGDDINDVKIVNFFLKQIIDGENIVLNSPGLQKRTYCYIKDCILGIILSLVKGKFGEVYNISSRNNATSIVNLANLIVELFGNNKQKVIFKSADKFELKKMALSQNMLLDNEKIKSLGYQESVNLKSGLKRLYEYYQTVKENNK